MLSCNKIKIKIWRNEKRNKEFATFWNPKSCLIFFFFFKKYRKDFKVNFILLIETYDNPRGMFWKVYNKTFENKKKKKCVIESKKGH